MSDHSSKSERFGRPSRLARLQQVLVLGSLLFATAWFLFWWPRSVWLAVVGAALCLLGYALVLGLEGLAAARLNKTDEAPQAGWSGVAGAWWQEVRVAPQVFAWRQPFRWRELPDTVATKAAAPGAAVLIHGFVCNRGFWLPWMSALRERGVPYASVNLEPVFGPIDDYVGLIEEAVDRAEGLSALKPVLVCHSMGGLAARAWLASAPGNAARVRSVITIGTPHHGTWLARLSHLENGQQMRPDGPWLAALARLEAAQAPAGRGSLFVCWYANTDNVVFPAQTATLPGADNRLIRGAAHVDLAFHPTVMNESLSMLASASNSPNERTAS